MSLQVKIGTFQKPSSTTGNQSITGVGFQPKIIILTTGSKASLETAWGDRVDVVQGMAASGGGSSYVWQQSQDALATTNDNSRVSTSVIGTDADASGGGSAANFVSFDADGFTINWVVNEANTFYIGYLALGGTSIRNAFVKTGALTAASATDTFTGAGFTPNFALWHAALQTGTGGAASIHTSYGFTDGSTQYGISVFSNDNAADSIADRWSGTANAWLGLDSNGAIDYQGTLTFNSDGGVLTYSNQASGAWRYGILFVEFEDVKVGTFSKATGAAPATNTVSSIGFDPLAILMLTHAAVAGAATSAITSWGVDDGTNRWVADTYVLDAAATSDSKSRFGATKSLVIPRTTPAEAAEATAAMGSNQFVVTWNPNDGTADLVGYVAIGGSRTILPQVIQHSEG